MAEYLDYTGLTYFKNKLDQQNNNKYVAKGIKINGVALNSSDITIHAVDSTARIPASEKGIANGVATLDSTGKVPSSQLPSYVDDVKEYENLANFPSTGETDKLYLAIDTGNIYRWSGSQYVQINNSVSTADQAVKDGDGNTITTTYATKTENAAKLDANSANYIKSLSISGKTITYKKGDNTTGTLTTQDTVYGAGTAALLTAGEDTANRVWTAKILHDALPVTMTGATASEAGNGGLVPAPAAGKQTSFLRGDGTWVIPTDTNTHYTTHLYAGSGTAANATTTNGNTKITVADDSTVRNSVTIKGTGATSVTSDASGVITVNSPAYSAMTASEVTTGTATTARTITAKVLSDFVTGKVDALDIGVTSVLQGSTNGTIDVEYYDTSKNDTVTVYTHPNTVTAGTVGTSSATSGIRLAVPYVTYNANGHITATGTHTHTIPNFVKSGTGASAGLVPSPGTTAGTTKFLREDGTWVVPTDTNTHYTTHLYVGSGTAANAATTNGNTKLALYDDSTSRSTITIKGTGATGVTSDANGVITINSTAYSAMTKTELDGGTATTSRLITAKVLSDFVEGATSSITTEQIDALFV